MDNSMVNYSDIHLSDLKNLSLKSFTEVLINDFYPFLFSELNNAEKSTSYLKLEFDIGIIESINQKIYNDFDEMFRKEKLVLFPFILKLESENKKSETCSPFKNTKAHFTSIIKNIEDALKLCNEIKKRENKAIAIFALLETYEHFKGTMIELQNIKDRNFYLQFKSCSGCQKI